MPDRIGPLSPQDALMAAMIVTSAADERMTESEMREIAAMVGLLPVFADYDADRRHLVMSTVNDLFDEEEEGLETILGLIKASLPEHLRETAYALACDVAAADGRVALGEMRLLEEMRHTLEIDRLNAAAIERGSRARHTRL